MQFRLPFSESSDSHHHAEVAGIRPAEGDDYSSGPEERHTVQADCSYLEQLHIADLEERHTGLVVDHHSPDWVARHILPAEVDNHPGCSLAAVEGNRLA